MGKNKNMKFIKDYFNNDALREELNELTRQTYGFDFESWYRAGYWYGDYIPYSYEENGKLLSNASANIMKFILDGVEKSFIQIGTVMTVKDCRNRGYARELINRIIDDYKDKVDGIYLFGNLDALKFYEKLSFTQGLQYRYYLKPEIVIDRKTDEFQRVLPDNDKLVQLYKNMIKESISYSQLEQINKYSLHLFYTMNFEDVYYSNELECFVCYELDNNILYINSILSKHDIPLKSIIERIQEDYKEIILGFTPIKSEQNIFVCKEYDGAEDYRFCYIGEKLKIIEENKLYFPEYSHA